jgi:hypothetical protein
MEQPKTLLGLLTGQRHWQRYETFRHRFEASARELGERESARSLSRLSLSQRQFVRWLYGELRTLPRPDACRVLEEMFGRPASQLFAPPPQPAETGVVVSGPVLAPPAERAWESSGADDAPTGDEDAIMAAARESGDFLRFAESSNVGPHTIDQFQADIRRIVQVYPNRPVMPLFHEVRTLRDRAFELLIGRQPPHHTRDLYLIAGTLCGILSNASLDMGNVPAAETQARTALLCAELAGNNALRSWIYGALSVDAYWDDRPYDAIRLAQLGWQYVPESGASRVRLASYEARAHARLGNAAAAEEALRRATASREDVVDEDDVFSHGMLSFPLAKQLYCESETHLWLGGEAQRYQSAERAASSAVELYLQGPPEQRRLDGLCLARLDVADARLGQNKLDGAADEVRQVMATSAKRRTEPVSRRLAQLGARLDRPKLRRSPLALRLREEIRTYRAGPPVEGSV